MLKALRLLTIILSAGIFWGAWYIVPGLLTVQGLRWASGIVTILWALEIYFFQRISALSSADGLTSSEHERLIFRLSSIRRRVWWVGGVGLICSILMWILAGMALPGSSPHYAALAGVLFGISISYLILVPGWLGEYQSFVDDIRHRETLRKRREKIANEMSQKTNTD